MKTLTFLLLTLGLLILGFFLAIKANLIQRLPPIQNFEEQEFSEAGGFIEPFSIVDGLAVYTVGTGEPVLLFPYPHAHTKEPMAQGPLAQALVEMGRTVITFDVPGAYRSTQKPVGDMTEMLSSAEKTLGILGIDGPIDVVGHSMGGLAALAFSIEHPARTNKLVLIGSMSGFPAVMKSGMPKSVWQITEPDYWKFIFLGLKVKTGFGNLANHKNLYNIMSEASLHDKSLFSPMEIAPDDYLQGTPIRELVWGQNIFQKLDYSSRLNTVNAPTLILAGRNDPEAPLPCSEELHQEIPNSRLIVFENSGHNPFLEELELFEAVVTDFFQTESND